jgi:fructan beta-fructosidase
MRSRFFRSALCVFAVAFPAHADEPDIVFADFEGATYGDWVTTGTAFGSGPAKGTLPNQMPVTGFKGKGLVNSYLGGDKSTGTLTSPEFTVQRKHIKFLIGGGGFAGKTCMNLVVDDKVARTATGPNLDAGGSEELHAESWDVSELIGKKAKIVIVDDATDGWGHINVDDIVFSNTPVKKPVREIVAAKKYLQFPVKNKGPMRHVKVFDGKNIVAEFTIELADAAPDWWAPLDVSKLRDKTLRIETSNLPEGSKALDAIAAVDRVTGSDTLYKEKLRPQLHFSPSRGWTNDPNGMVYSDGEWHLYFQHNPYGVDWGNMHWGHAVSKDLVHWEELPIALAPHKFGDWAFSGSAVVDRDNTSGWKTGDNALLVGAYTSTGRGECIIYSNDRGRTWKEFDGNPVVKHAGRDPRLLWHTPSKRWVMAVYDETDRKRWIAFYTSPDLKTWTYKSRIEGFYECPDLFELPVDGDAKKSKWVLTAASSDYMVGTFDGATFTPETKMLPGNKGRGFYAAQTFANAPDGRVIQIGWLQAPSPGMSFNQAMSLPLELGLKSTADGPRLTHTPVKELKALWQRTHSIQRTELKANEEALKVTAGKLLQVQTTLVPSETARFALTVRGVALAYDAKTQELRIGEHKVNVPLRDGKLSLRVFADRTAFEIFIGDGLIYVPLPMIPKSEHTTVTLVVAAGKVQVDELQVDELTSIWTK